jgi:SAM-dependent methyltransferase
MRQGDREHWESIYAEKPEEMLSWSQPSPVRCLKLIRQFSRPGSSVIDIGGGSSTLAGMLVEEGFSPCTVLDISSAALERARSRLDPAIQTRIDWRVADLLDEPELPKFDVWHDRAVFHFLVEPEQRAAYVKVAERTVAPLGLMVMATFALDGPEKCSGLPVERYDAASLARHFEQSFRLKHEDREMHETPWGVSQPFLFVVLERL